MDEWLTVNEVANLLKVNPETVRRWLRDADMRGSLLSDRAGWRVSRDEVQRFMRERQNVSQGELPGETVRE